MEGAVRDAFEDVPELGPKGESGIVLRCYKEENNFKIFSIILGVKITNFSFQRNYVTNMFIAASYEVLIDFYSRIGEKFQIKSNI